MVATGRIDVRTKGQGDVRDLTDAVGRAVSSASLDAGTVTVFVTGSTAGITTIECEPGAVADLDRAYERVAPRHGDSRLDLGVLLRQRRQMDGAVEQLKAAREILPDLGTYAMALGTTYLQMGRTAEAVAELEAAVGRRPTWAMARAALAAALMDEGRIGEASEHARVAVFLAPDNPQFRRLAAAAARRARR